MSLAHYKYTQKESESLLSEVKPMLHRRNVIQQQFKEVEYQITCVINLSHLILR
jgi:hypothetical protein